MPDLRVVSSLAGRTGEPLLPAGEVRSGGFGGIAAMADWLRARTPAIVVDATHPFAQRISESAVAAAEAAGCALLRLQRPGWVAVPGDRWLRVADAAAAADLVPTVGRRPLLTLGRQELAPFIEHPACSLLPLVARCVEPPDGPLPPRTTVLLGRAPYPLAGERALMHSRGIDVLVTRDSGGEATSSKLDAARELGLPVVMIDRPPAPVATTVGSVDEAERWVRDRLGSTAG